MAGTKRADAATKKKPSLDLGTTTVLADEATPAEKITVRALLNGAVDAEELADMLGLRDTPVVTCADHPDAGVYPRFNDAGAVAFTCGSCSRLVGKLPDLEEAA